MEAAATVAPDPVAPAYVQHGAGHTRYRADIDGLRSIAVLGVVLYHFGVPGFSGGYVGVDIFFVISGFLIGRSIISDMRAGTWSLLGFYERRIRRLYPAFIAMAAVSIPLFWLLLLPPDLRAFGRSLTAATVYLSNVAFYREQGYFDASAVTKPLLHTWSLSVEEQFYVVFPLLVYATVRWRPAALAGVVAAVGVLSFGAAQWMLAHDAAGVFFLFPYRAWELLTGVGLTMVVEGRAPERLGRAREPIALAGLAAILAPIFLYRPETPFPALAAVPPCLGAALLILAGSGSTSLASRLLATRPPVFVGLVSYSFYLWHWPVLVALSSYYGSPLGRGAAAAGVLASFGLAWVSWRLVERYPRRPGVLGRRALFAWAIALSALLAAVGLLFWRTDGLPGRFSGPEAPLVRAAEDFSLLGGLCYPTDNPVYPGLVYCHVGVTDAPPTFLVWGDSHARAHWAGLDLLARERGRAGIHIWSAGCPPLFGLGKHEVFDSGEEAPACRRSNELMAQVIGSTPSLRSVILIGRWSYYATGRGIGRDAVNRITLVGPDGRPAASAEAQAELFARSFRRTVDRLRAAGLRVYVLEQTPELPNSDAGVIARGIVHGTLSHDDAVRLTEEPRAAVEARQAIAHATFTALAREGRVTVLPTHDFFCGPVTCTGWRHGAPALFDDNHVTGTTALALRGRYLPAMGD